MRWLLPDSALDAAAVRAVAGELSVHPLVAEILVRRGHATPSAAAAFLGGELRDLPDPSLLMGMDAAVERLARAIRGKEAIVAYGDYAVDGVSSTALLTSFVRAVGGTVRPYLPNRLTEGYGLNRTAVEALAGQGTKLLVTLDCGVTQVEEVDRAVALGMDVVVVDHHQVSPELPRAVAILNPQQPGCAFPHRHLCAAGVTFFLLAGLRRKLRSEGFFETRPEPRLRDDLDLVALATIADVVPLTGVNRLLVKHGLIELARGSRPGLRALKLVADLPATGDLNCGQVAFRLAPRLNAAGRMDDAGRALKLLLAESDAEAAPLARELDAANRERQTLEGRILDEAVKMLSAQGTSPGAPLDDALVLASPDWHAGVVGIVASRLVERTGRPSLILAISGDEAKGSGRSVPGFNLHEGLIASADLLTRFGGHTAAAGLALPTANIEALRQRLGHQVRAKLTPEELGPRCRIDALVDAGALDERLALDLAKLRPFGSGNPEPVFASFGLRGEGRTLASKRKVGETHLKLRVTQGKGSLEGIGFGLGGDLPVLREAFDAAFHLELDEWQGRQRLQLRLKTLRPAA